MPILYTYPEGPHVGKSLEGVILILVYINDNSYNWGHGKPSIPVTTYFIKTMSQIQEYALYQLQNETWEVIVHTPKIMIFLIYFVKVCHLKKIVKFWIV